MNIFHILFYVPIEKALLFLYDLTGHNLGFAIILLTILIRLILIPLMLPSLKSAEKIKLMKPELDRIKKQFAQDPKRLQEEQMALYKKYGINPAAGCLPVLLQLPVLIFLYQVFLNVLSKGEVNAHFWLFDLTKPDGYYLLPILSCVFQFILSYMMSSPSPKKEIKQEKKEQDFAESLSSALQTQNLYVMPILWFFIMFKLPAGISLYWTVSTIFSVLQQLIFVGPGRLKTLFSHNDSQIKNMESKEN